MITNLLEPLLETVDFTPALRAVASRSAAEAAAGSAAEACLETPFRPALEEQVSFLVNGFWLIGRHRIREFEPRDGAVAEALRALGHEVVASEVGSDATGAIAGGAVAGGPGAGGAVAAGAAPSGGGFDRAMLISRALGYAGDGDPVARLKAMQRALRPGGLALFHVLDRDRAWGLVRDFTACERAAGIAFDPRRGEVTVRVRPVEVTGGEILPGGREAIRAFNLGEVEALLASAGLKLERAYGGWSGGSVEEEGEWTGRILVVASKPRRPARRKTAGNKTFRAAPRRGKAGEGRNKGGGGT